MKAATLYNITSLRLLGEDLYYVLYTLLEEAVYDRTKKRREMKHSQTKETKSICSTQTFQL